ncbi:hypothetical protein BVG16_00230 [Paenibacillus selenitireducens]|uniref:DUF1802 domain-containing protein n=1 Tax=Paenibacillus selenitireducens TaxID=1324314 RepID=A0A1T2XLU2_9BACL|nr:DUF1802 family protein [Paenibacillus selenitireducens]OPA80821.1 hypothetical protein BVG16_00230 [Paenibacillus selenitireducens]
MPNLAQPVALKEWAVAIQALADGKQILLMRKGGIIEETRHFELKSHSFYLYPTFEHQRRELLKDAYQSDLDATLVGWSAEDTRVPLQLYAEVVEDIEIHDQDMLNRLRDFHIWTDQFAEERLKWKKKLPLHVLVLRVYKIVPSVTLDIESEYLGCKSWITMPKSVTAVDYTNFVPVLRDEAFQEQVDAIHNVLEG